MKILTVCANGNVRAVTLARILKAMSHDALACGVDRNSPETIAYLAKWADKIYVTHSVLIEKMPKGFRDKIVDFNVGPDVWGKAMHPDLVKILKEKIKKEKLE